MAAPMAMIVLSLKLLIIKQKHLLSEKNLAMYVMFINVSISVILKNSFT